MSTTQARREAIRLAEPAAPTLALQVRRPHAGTLGDVAPVILVSHSWGAAVAARYVGSASKSAITIEHATHLMHLESQRGLLYNAVYTFLQRIAT